MKLVVLAKVNVTLLPTQVLAYEKYAISLHGNREGEPDVLFSMCGVWNRNGPIDSCVSMLGP